MDFFSTSWVFFLWIFLRFIIFFPLIHGRLFYHFSSSFFPFFQKIFRNTWLYISKFLTVIPYFTNFFLLQMITFSGLFHFLAQINCFVSQILWIQPFFFSRIYLSSPTNLSFLNILIFSPVFSWVHVCLKLFKLFFMNSTFFSLYHY